ncbi:MAG: glycosyltransferase family 4 protein [Chloroflexi bacterium]|nr:glycosyltransferase family 4 protein [Chloroflexota bacterium]
MLNQYYPPDTSATAPITQDVAQALAKKHSVTVVCGRPSYAPTERHPYYLLRRTVEEGINVHRVGATAFHRRGKVGRILNYLSFLVLGFLRILTISPKPDVIIAMTDPPVVAIVGALAAFLRRCRFVYNIRDLHPDMAIAAGFTIPAPVRIVWETTHRWALRRADLVIALGEDMRDRVLEKGIAPDRVVVVRDGAWPLAQSQHDGADIVKKIRGDAKFVLLHAGNIGFAGNWETLVEAARQLEKEDVGLTFVGDGARRKELEVEARGVNNIRFLPFFPSDDISSVLAAADMHVVAIRPGIEGLVVPSKLYPILMAGKPVLVLGSENTDAARVVQQAECGIVVAPDDVSGVVSRVRELVQKPEQLIVMGQKALSFSTRFSREKELSRYIAYIETIGCSRSGESNAKPESGDDE